MTRTNKTARRALAARVEVLEGRVVLSPGGVVYNPHPPIANGPHNFVLIQTDNTGPALSNYTYHNPNTKPSTGPINFSLINTNNSGAGLSKALISTNPNTNGTHTITLISTNNSGAGLSKGFSVSYTY